jgi:hypothetical protein
MFCAKKLDPHNITGAYWGQITPATDVGSYLVKLSNICNTMAINLKDNYGFDLSLPIVYNEMRILSNIGRVKGKTGYQNTVYCYREGRQAHIMQSRTDSYYKKLEEVITNHWPAYCRHVVKNKITTPSEEYYYRNMGECLKLLTEFSICDLPLPVSRLKLLHTFAKRFNVDLLVEYAALLGAMMMHGIFTNQTLRAFGQPIAIIERANICKERLIADHGDPKAIYHTKETRLDRLNYLKSIDDAYAEVNALFEDPEEVRNNNPQPAREDMMEEEEHRMMHQRNAN